MANRRWLDPLDRACATIVEGEDGRCGDGGCAVVPADYCTTWQAMTARYVNRDRSQASSHHRNELP